MTSAAHAAQAPLAALCTAPSWPGPAAVLRLNQAHGLGRLVRRTRYVPPCESSQGAQGCCRKLKLEKAT